LKKINTHNSLKHRIELLKKYLIIFICILFISSFQNADAAIRIWTGATNSDWTLASNWGGTVPNADDDVRIPGGLTNYPVISTDVTVKSIQINSTGAGATLTIEDNANLILNKAKSNYEVVAYGGTLIQNGGTITFYSRVPTIAGTFLQSGGSLFTDKDIVLTGVINQSGGLIQLSKNPATNPKKKFIINGGIVNQSGGTLYLRDFNPSSGSFNQTGSNAVLRIFRTWEPDSDHSFNATNGTVHFAGRSGGADFTSPNTQFHHILIDDDVDPKFDNEANSLIRISGDFTNNNTNLENSADAIFTFNGDTEQTITSASTGDRTTFGQLIINNSNADVTLASNINIEEGVTIKAGGSFNLSNYNVGDEVALTGLVLEGGAAIGASISGTGTLNIESEVTVNLAGTGSDGASLACPVYFESDAIINVADGGVDPDLVISGSVSGSNNLTKSGAGELVLSGENTYSGQTIIGNGILSINTLENINGGNSSLGAPATSANAIIDISSTGTLKYIGSGNVSDRPINLTGSGGTLEASGSGTLTLNGNITGNGNDLILSGNGSGNINGIIDITSGGVTKKGEGKWILSNANTYTGTTNINAGIFELGDSERIADASSILMSGGTFSTGSPSGFSETMGTLIVSDSSTIMLGTGAHTINFAASNSESWTTGKILTITGWTGGYDGTEGTVAKIFVGNSSTGLTDSQLNQIFFFDGTDYFSAQMLSTGELVANPPAISIITGIITGSPFCDNFPVLIPFTISGIYSTGNIFTAQLSDETGSFSFPQDIGSITSTTADTITGAFPVNTDGTAYRIRVVSSAPPITGTPNDSDLVINSSLSVNINLSVSENPICTGDTVTFTAIPINGGTSPAYQWKLNGLNVGTDSDTFTISNLSDGDSVYCELLSNLSCVSNNPATSDAITISVEPVPIATFYYADTTYCQWDTNPFPTFIGGGFPGTFSSTPGLVFVSTTTGEIDISASTPGAYIVTNTIISAGDCGNSVAESPVIITSNLIWTGAVSSDWNDSENWSCRMLPETSVPVEIPNALNQPVLNLGDPGATGDIIIRAGSSLTIVDNTLEISGSINNNGILNSKQGTIEMNGTTSQIIAGSYFQDDTIFGLTINNPSGVSLTDPIYVTGILNPLDGTLSADGNLTLVSTAAQTALVQGLGTGNITGNVTVQRYLPSAFGYKYFSSPFQSATVNEFADEMDLGATFPTFYSYDESRITSGWVNYTNPAGLLVTLEGYAVNFGPDISPLTVNMTGILNNGDYQRTMYNNNNPYTRGFNLAGNPYPSPIDWNATAGWTKTNIDDALYFFKSGGYDQYSGTYHTYINGISSDGLASNIIPSMQGFFIHVSDGVFPTAGALGMTNEVRVNDFSQQFFKSVSDDPIPYIRLTAQFIDIQKSTDAMVIYFDEQANPVFDKEYDALKLLNTDLYVPSYYTMSSDGYKLSINSLPVWVDSILVVPAGIKLVIDGSVKFKLIDMEYLPSETYVYLYDDATKVNHSLTFEKDHTVYLEAGEYDNRFLIKLAKGSSLIPSDSDQPDLLNATSYNGNVIVDVQLKTGGKGMIYINSISGKNVFKKEIYEGGDYTFNPNLKTGIYVVTLISDDVKKSRKLFIQTK